jgi:hypothetical protein
MVVVLLFVVVLEYAAGFALLAVWLGAALYWVAPDVPLFLSAHQCSV